MKTIMLLMLSICFGLVSNQVLAGKLNNKDQVLSGKLNSKDTVLAEKFKSKNQVNDKSKQIKFLMCVKKSEIYCAKHSCGKQPNIWCKSHS